MKDQIIVFCSLFVAVVGSRSADLVGVLDLHGADVSTGDWNAVNQTGVDTLRISRVGLSPPSVPIFGALSAAGFHDTAPASSPVNAVQYFELVANFSLPPDDRSDVFVYASVLRGRDAPALFTVSSSVDGYASVISWLNFSADGDGHPVTYATEVMLHVPTGGKLPGGGVIIRIAPATASANASSPSTYFALANSVRAGRVAVYTAPAWCPRGSRDACRHGAVALSSVVHGSRRDQVVTGECDHGSLGTYDCAAATDAPELKVKCSCNCYRDPFADGSVAYDACDDASAGSHAYAGESCAGATVTTAGGAAAFDACDTVIGALTVSLASAGAVTFPRVRRITGQLILSGATTSAAFPYLETVGGGVAATGAALTAADLSRVRDICGKVLAWDSPAASVAVPMLGTRLAAAVRVKTTAADAGVDIGSVGGGPVELTGDNTGVLVLSADPPAALIARVTGLGALRRVRSRVGQRDEVQFVGVSGTLEFLGVVDFGGEESEGRAVAFELQSCVLASAEVSVPYLRAVASLGVRYNDGIVAFHAPRVCGTSLKFLYVDTNAGMHTADLGSLGGGPLAVESGASDAIRLRGASNADRLTTILGLTRLQRVASRSGTVDGVRLSYLGADAWPRGVRDATWGVGSERLQLGITWCDFPATLVFPGVVEVESLSVTACAGTGAAFAFPHLAGTEMKQLAIYNNPGVTALDIGSVGGGPQVVRGTATNPLYISGASSAPVTSLVGLTRLARIESGAGADRTARYAYLRLPELPATIMTAAYGTGSSRMNLFLQGIELTGSGDVTFSGATDVSALSVRNCIGIRAVRLPHLATDTFSSLVLISNVGLHTLDLGSVAGGPRAFTPASGSSSLIDVRNDPLSRVSSWVGLGRVESVGCSPAGAAPCAILFQYADGLPPDFFSHITNLGGALARPTLRIRHSSFASPVDVDMANVTDMEWLEVQSSTNLTALRVPNLNTTAMGAILIADNGELVHADLGSAGGGPETLTGTNDHTTVLEIGSTIPRVLDNVTGLDRLRRIASRPSQQGPVIFRLLGPNTVGLATTLGAVEFGTGTEAVALTVEHTPFPVLRFAAAAQLHSLTVTENAALTQLRFDAMPADGIVQTVTVTNNAALPEACALAPDPFTPVPLVQSGNNPSGTCP
eukprot:TRINITY_DN87_c0_g1_i1.p1 TRINITY_DN87_c0_g1~~TRINITY_DN87_c0_g1_i1.p1  ORF type:complete len:1149 (+),score=290.20 TRINITY_DN87_c0_g1_i1:149-3595(+)